MSFINHELDLSVPAVMGVLNVTPDSFSDGGNFTHIDVAISTALQMVKDGASIIDIGGESTRPGADAVSENDEIARVVPVIKALRSEFSGHISIDTNKASVMSAAIDAGASMINDVYALQGPNSMSVAAESQLPVCIMHMQGKPQTMQDNPQYDSVVGDVFAFFEHRIDACVQNGIALNKIIIDPGFGFGKTLSHNYQLLKHLNKFGHLGVPVLAGMSRKSMIGKVIDRPVDQRLAGSLACAILALEKGASILRVHDVPETVDIVKIHQEFSLAL